MITGVARAPELKVDDKAETQQASEAKPLTRMERIIRKLNQMLEYDDCSLTTRGF